MMHGRCSKFNALPGDVDMVHRNAPSFRTIKPTIGM